MSEQSQPLVTVVTVVYNGEASVEETIQSVIGQTYSSVQYILIDGGSTDKTLEIVDRYKDKIDIVVSGPDKGIYDAMNKGLALAKGTWINFMNVGDRFYDSKTLESVFSLPALDEFSIIYGNHEVLYDAGKRMKYPASLNQLWKGMTIQHQSIFVKTERLKNRPFDLSYKYAADFDLVYDCFKNGEKFLYIDQCMSTVSALGVSETNSIKTYREFGEVVLKYEKNALRYRLYYKQLLLKRKLIELIKTRFPWINQKRIALLSAK
jgi:glycosyltransferase involved in cell wall biosynthesis